MSRKAVLALVSGAAVSQVISLALSPLVTRLFSPEAFGIYALLVAAVSIFGPLCCLKYDMAIVKADSDADSRGLFVLSGMIAPFFSLAVAIPYGVFVFRDKLSGGGLILMGFMVWAVLLAQGISLVLTSAANRRTRYGAVSRSIVLRSAVSNAAFLLLGLAGFGVWGLVAGQLLGAIAGVIALMGLASLRGMPTLRRRDWDRLPHLAFLHRSQPFFNMPAALLGALSFTAVLFAIDALYEASDVGHYALANRLLGVPIAVLTMSVARVLFQTINSRRQRGQVLTPLLRRSLWYLMAPVVPAMVLLALFSPWLFGWVFGAEWRGAGVLVGALAPWFGARLVVESLSPLFIVLDKQRVELVGYACALVGQLVLFAIAGFTGMSIFSLLLSVSLWCLLVNGCFVVLLLVWCRRHDQELELGSGERAN